MDSRREVFVGEIHLEAVIEWVVSETMSLDVILKSVKNERSRGPWDGALKNAYIFRTGGGRKPPKRQKRSGQSGRREEKEKAPDPKEGGSA